MLNLSTACNKKRIDKHFLSLLALCLVFTLLMVNAFPEKALAANVGDVVTQVTNDNLGSAEFNFGQEEATGYGFDIHAGMGDLGSGGCQLSVLGPAQQDEIQIMIDYIDSISQVSYMQTTQLKGCELREYDTEYGVGIGIILPDYFITVETMETGQSKDADMAFAKKIAQQTIDGMERAGLLSQAAPDIESGTSEEEKPAAGIDSEASLPAAAEPVDEPVLVADTTNIMAVYNGPTVPTTFSIDSPHLVTEIHNYHWNDGQGAAPGTIGLQDQNGKMYGPWQAVATPGQGGVPNANWFVYPKIVIPAGTYTIIDSDPSTWSQNGDSGGKGMSYVKATPHFEITGAAPAGTGNAPGSYPTGDSHSPAGVGSVGSIPGPSNTTEAVTGVVAPGLIAIALGALGSLGGGGFSPPAGGVPMPPTGGGPLPGAGSVPGTGKGAPGMAQATGRLGRRGREEILVDTRDMSPGGGIQENPADQGIYIENDREAGLFVQPEPLINDPGPEIFIDTIDMNQQAIDIREAGGEPGIHIDTTDMFEGNQATGASGDQEIFIETEAEAGLFTQPEPLINDPGLEIFIDTLDMQEQAGGIREAGGEPSVQIDTGAMADLEMEPQAFSAREGEAGGVHFAAAEESQGTPIADQAEHLYMDTEETEILSDSGSLEDHGGTEAAPETTVITEETFDQNGFDAEGYDRDGFNEAGFNAQGYDRAGFDAEGFDKAGFDVEGFDKAGFDAEGFNKAGFNVEGYDKNGFDRLGFDKEGYNQEGFDQKGYDREGFGRNGYDAEGFNREGFDQAGFDKEGFNQAGFDKEGFDRQGFDKQGLDREGFDKAGFDVEGYDRQGFDQEGFDKEGFNQAGFDKEGFDQAGFDKEGFDRQGFDKQGLDREGFDKAGFDVEGYDRQGFDQEGFDKEGFNREGFDQAGFDKEGFDRQGFNQQGLDREGFNKAGFDAEGFDRQGYDINGYDRKGFNRSGFDAQGFDKQGYDKEGFNKDGWDREGYDRNGLDDQGWDRGGYDKFGYDEEGYDRDGYNREGQSKEGYDADGYDKNGFNENGFDRDGYDREGFDFEGYNRSGRDPWGYDRQGYGKDGYHWSGYNDDGYNREGMHWTDNPYEGDSPFNVDVARNPFDGGIVIVDGVSGGSDLSEGWKPTKPPLGEPYHQTVEKYGAKPWTDEIPAPEPERPSIPSTEDRGVIGPEDPMNTLKNHDIPIPEEDVPQGEWPGSEPEERFPGDQIPETQSNTFDYTDPETGVTSTYEYEPGYLGPRHGERQILTGGGDGQTYEIEFNAVTGKWVNRESGNEFDPSRFESWQRDVAEDKRRAAIDLEKMARREDANSKAIDKNLEDWRKLEQMQKAADKYDIGTPGGPGDVDKAIQNLKDDMLAGKELDQEKMDKIRRVIDHRIQGQTTADTGERWNEDWFKNLGWALEANAATAREVVTGEKADGSTSWLGMGARIMIMGATGGLAGGASLTYVTLDGAMNVAEAMYRIKDEIDKGGSDLRAVSKAVGLFVLGEEMGWLAGEAGGRVMGELFERFPAFSNQAADLIENAFLKASAKNQVWSKALGMVTQESAESSLDQINKRLVDIGSDQAAREIIDSARKDFGLRSVADSFDDVTKGAGKTAAGTTGDVTGRAAKSTSEGWTDVVDGGGTTAARTRGGRAPSGSDDISGGSGRAASAKTSPSGGDGPNRPPGGRTAGSAGDGPGGPPRGGDDGPGGPPGGGNDLPGEPDNLPLNRGGRTSDEVLADPAALNRAERSVQQNMKNFDQLPPSKQQELIRDQAIYDEYRMQAEERVWNLADRVQRGEPLTVEDIMEMKSDPASMRTLKNLEEMDGLGAQLTPQEAQGIQREFNNVMDEYVHQPSYRSVEDHLHNRYPNVDPEGIRVRTVRTPGTEPTDFNINTDNDVIAERLVNGPHGPEWVEIPKGEWEDTYYKALAENSGFSAEEAGRRFPDTDWANMDEAAQYRQWAKHHEEAAMDQFDLSAGRDFSDQRTWRIPDGDLPGRPMIELTEDEIARGVDFVTIDGRPMRPSTGYELTQRGQGTMLDPEQLSMMEQHKFDDYWNAGDTPAQVMRNQTEAMEQLRKTASVAETVERSYRDMGYRVEAMPDNMKQAIAVIRNNDLSPVARAARLQELGYTSPGDFLNKVSSRIGAIRTAQR
ncbi:hypothetical protein [Dehalobacterium formicoaceticum]|uniref:hypothetical protein n=1 Tax=Dehalobacterium formicoaceticum TaxID=51515 RepID=UPI0031F70089